MGDMTRARGRDGRGRTARAVRISKRLALVLRHRPESIGITLDEAGWVGVADLLAALSRHGLQLSRNELEQVVATSDKQRFAFDETRQRIRASQGHSLPVDLGYAPAVPPAVLYHGTPVRNVAAILAEGLRRGSRHHVHLSADVATARRVGQRRGQSAVLTVDASGLAAAGSPFYRSANGVWLVAAVPPDYLAALDADAPPSSTERTTPSASR
jgi:putative RNA 2'-phosphotransferase